MNTRDRRKRRVWINSVAALSSLAVVGVYMVNLGFNPAAPTPVNSALLPLTADKTATQFQLTRFNQSGEIDHYLTAAKAEFYKPDVTLHAIEDDEDGEFDDNFSIPDITQSQAGNSEVAYLYSPQLRLNQNSESYSSLKANTGRYFPASGTVELKDSVSLYNASTNTTLATSFLTVDISQKQVLTESEVELNNSESVITARGLSGDLAQQQWKLLDDVKSIVQVSK